ncbi:MAG: leucyl/phenylalanyl-tRNA--protein transferase [Gammaproteobacteria bacterium]
MTDITILHPGDPPDAFPDPSAAATEPNGLLAVGGDLEPDRLMAAYARGIFPWYQAGQPILWWSPDPRAIIVPERLHISRSLRRTMRRNQLQVSVDLAFGAVVAGCAESRRTTGTWITSEMQIAYRRLHDLGHAHAVEVWRDTELVGGVYGVVLGRVFFGESMFSRETDASKVALVRLARLAKTHDLRLIDCQIPNAHLSSLGSQLMPRRKFLECLRLLTSGNQARRSWQHGPSPVADCLEPPFPSVPLHV